MTSNEKLKVLMNEYGLRRRDVSELIGVSIHTVDAWKADPNSKKYRNMPTRMLEFLKMRIGVEGHD